MQNYRRMPEKYRVCIHVKLLMFYFTCIPVLTFRRFSAELALAGPVFTNTIKVCLRHFYLFGVHYLVIGQILFRYHQTI